MFTLMKINYFFFYYEKVFVNEMKFANEMGNEIKCKVIFSVTIYV